MATQSSASGLRTPATVTLTNASSGSGAPPVLTLIASISGGGGVQLDTAVQRPRNTSNNATPEPERPIATYARVWLRPRTQNVPQAKMIILYISTGRS
ncbi:hypothetical protein BDA96_03G351600 [Sorghum bicolor]|uniref:Uncharacterized protein n=1 Tax=Sorghum bicolor TaxID=4558 RepID=A0A921RG65_SORBI|nr:hypothetical protein BDA96_03G351600 [Sorghum bicolor]